jgi:hypothetical protein
MVGSNVNPFLAVILVRREHTSYSQSSDSIANPRKTASRNYCKNLSAIQRSDQKLQPFIDIIMVWGEQTSSSPSSDFKANPRKATSGKLQEKFVLGSMVRSKVTALWSHYCGLV